MKPDIRQIRSNTAGEALRVNYSPLHHKQICLTFFYNFAEKLKNNLKRNTTHRAEITPDEWNQFDKHLKAVFTLYFGENMI